MPALSRLWTCDQAFREAHRGVFYDVNHPVQVERFQLVKAAQVEAVSLVFDLVSQAYMEPHDGQFNTVGKESIGVGAFTLATKTIVIAMNSPFISDDRGNAVMFVTNTGSVFLARVDQVTAGNTIVIRGNMPAADAVVDVLLMAPTSPNGDALSLEDLNFMRVGNQIRLRITSDATRWVEELPEEEFDEWQGSEIGNRHKIVWKLVGDSVYFKKGSSLADYGTITIWLPRVPTAPSAGTDMLDIPDSALTRICINILEREIRKRKGLPFIDRTEENVALLRSLYQQFVGQVNLETIEKKAKALA